MTTKNGPSQKPDASLSIPLDFNMEKSPGADIAMAIVQTDGKLDVLLAAASLHRVFASPSGDDVWITRHVGQGGLRLGDDYLVSPDSQVFFTLAGARKVAVAESSGKTQGLLEWLDELEAKVAPALLGIVGGALRDANPGTIH